MPIPNRDRRYVLGKGSWRRPRDEQKYRKNHDRIFGKKEERCCIDCGHFDWMSVTCSINAKDVSEGPCCNLDQSFVWLGDTL